MKEHIRLGPKILIIEVRNHTWPYLFHPQLNNWPSSAGKDNKEIVNIEVPCLVQQVTKNLFMVSRIKLILVEIVKNPIDNLMDRT